MRSLFLSDKQIPVVKNTSDMSSSLTLVVSDGMNPISCYVLDDLNGDLLTFMSISVPKIPDDRMADTIGAGDSFVAGYIQALTKGFDRKECIKRGVSVI